MTEYEKLQKEANEKDIVVLEHYDLSGTRLKGLYCDGVVAIDKDIQTDIEKACILAEELGHHCTAVGDILDQSSTTNRKQEMRGRVLAYNRLVGLRGIIDAYNHHCQGISESAEYLGVTEDYLNDSILYYKNKYGVYTAIDNYVIFFEPAVAVLELI